MKFIYILIAFLLGALLVYLFMPSKGDESLARNKLEIDSLRSVVKWKETKETHYRDSIKDADVKIQSESAKAKEADKRVSLADANAEQWRQKYYALKKIVPQNAKDSLRDLIIIGNACDSLVTELGDLSDRRKEQVTAITNELTAVYAKVKALDNLNLIVSSENSDLKKMDSLRVKNEKILKKKAKKAFIKGAIFGTPIGIIIALLII